MNLYDYLERNVNLDKISELNGDMYEMAELKYMINELSKLFYRNYTFFMFKEDLKNRTKIYERTIDPKNVEDFSVVCKSYCKLIKQLAKELYDIDTNLISMRDDKYRHVDLLVRTKEKKKYIISPFEDIENMQVGLRTKYFASKEYHDKAYKNAKEISFISNEELKEIDKKIGYTKDGKYLDDELEEVKNKLDNIEELSSTNDDISEELIGKKYDNEVLLNDEKIELKLKYILRHLNHRKNTNGFLDMVMYTKSVLKIFFTENELKKIKSYIFWTKEKDIKDEELRNVLSDKYSKGKKRGRIISCNGKSYVFSFG